MMKMNKLSKIAEDDNKKYTVSIGILMLLLSFLSYRLLDDGDLWFLPVFASVFALIFILSVFFYRPERSAFSRYATISLLAWGILMIAAGIIIIINF